MGVGLEAFRIVGTIALNDVNKVIKQIDGTVHSAKNATLGLGKMVDAINAWSKEQTKTLNKIKKEVDTAGLALSRGLTAPLAAVTGALGVLSLKTGNYADKLLSLEQSTGLTTDTLQEFQHVATAAGGSSDALFSSLTALTGKLPEIASGTGAASKAFDALGVNVTNADGSYRSMEEILPEVIKGLQGMDDITTRNILANDIFGKKTKEIAAILGMTSEEMDGLRKEAHDLGIVMGADGLNSANNFRVGVEKLKAQLAAVGMEIAVSVMPILNETLIPFIQTTAIPILRGLGDAAEWTIGVFAKLPPVLQGVTIGLGALVAAAGPALLVIGQLVGMKKNLIVAANVLSAGYVKLNASLISNKAAFLAARLSMDAGTASTGLLSGALGVLGGAFNKLRAVMLTHPIMTFAAIAAGALYAFNNFKKEFEDQATVKRLTAETEAVNKNTTALNAKVRATKEQLEAELKLKGTDAYNPAKVEQLAGAYADAVVELKNYSREINGANKMTEQQAAATRQNALALQGLGDAVKEETRLTEYQMAQKKKQEEEDAKAAEARAKRSAEEARRRREDLNNMLSEHNNAYARMGKTEMQLLDMEEQADIEKARRLGATDAQLESIYNHYWVMRQDLIEKEDEALEEQINEAKKALEERQQLELKYETDLQSAKRNIAVEEAKRDADVAVSTLQGVHGAELAVMERQGGDVRALRIKQDAEMRTLQAVNAQAIAAMELDNKKAALQAQYDAEIAEAEKAGTDASAIRERYSAEFANLEAQKIEAAKNAEAQITEITKRENAARAALNKQYVQGFVSGMISAVNQLGSILSMSSSNEQKRVDRDYKARKEAIEASVEDETERAAQLAALEEEKEAKTLEIQKQQAAREKGLGIFNAIINTAQAIVKALADLGPIAGPIMAGVVGALGAAQIGVIESTPEPFAAGGLVQGGRGGVYSQIGEGKQDELVLPLETGTQRLASDLSDMLQGQSASAAAPVQRPVNIYVGTLVADKHGLKELERQLSKVRVEENRRIGIGV